jgi:hypothetical protein
MMRVGLPVKFIPKIYVLAGDCFVINPSMSNLVAGKQNSSPHPLIDSGGFDD